VEGVVHASLPEIWHDFHWLPFERQCGEYDSRMPGILRRISNDGLTNNHRRSPGYPSVPSLEGNTPLFEINDLPEGDVDVAAHAMVQQYDQLGQGRQFMVFRGTLPFPFYYAAVVEAVQKLRPASEAIDTLTLAYLARLVLGGNNNDRVTYVSDTLPRAGCHAGEVRWNETFLVRNNGFNNLDGKDIILRGAFSPSREVTGMREAAVTANEGVEIFIHSSFFELACCWRCI